MKKKLLLVFLVFGIVSLVFFQKSGKIDAFIKDNFYTSLCKTPVYYSTGRIDPRFGLTKSDVIQASREATEIWKRDAGFEVFRYSPEAKLTINMIYDQRQSLDTQIRNLESDLASGKTTLDSEVATFESKSAQFESRKAEFERKIEEWNSNRGGSQEEYDALLREQDALANESDRLNSIANKLNVSASAYNSQVSRFNQTIDTFNNVLEEKPEEGLYDAYKSEIDIYFNNDRDKLIRTIAHELGHARGLGHTNSEKDMMYPITTSVLKLSKSDLMLLDKTCEPYPIYEPYIENMKNNLMLLKMSILSR